MPLPRLVFPTFEPVFSPDRNCRQDAQKRLAPVDSPAFVQSAKNALQTVSHLLSQFRSRRQQVVVRGIRQANPAASAVAQNPQNAFQHFAIVRRRPLATRFVWVVSAARDGSSPIGRRSVVNRIAPLVPPGRWLCEFISRFRHVDHHPFSTFYPVLKQVL